MKFSQKLWLQSAVGLDIGTASVRVVELRKFFRQIWLAKFGEEKIEPANFSEETAIKAIKKIIERLKIREKGVTIHISGKAVRHVVLESPTLPRPELKGWIREQIIKRLPISIKPSQLIVSFHILSQTEQSLKLIAAYCQPLVLEERISWIEKAGLVPIMVGAGALDIVQAFAFGGEGLFEQTIFFAWLSQDIASFLVTQNSTPVYYQEMEYDFNIQEQNTEKLSILKNRFAEILSDQQQQAQSKVDKIILAGDHTVNNFLNNVVPPDINVEVGSPLIGLLDHDQNLASDYSLAAGLALKKYFPLMNTIDLLPEGKKVFVKKQQEKKTALKFILGFGIFLFSAMLVLNVFKSLFESRLEATEEQMVVLNDQIFAVELTKKEQTKLHRTLEEMKRLVTHRSRYAELFQEISKIVPKSVWLNEISSKPVSVPKSENQINTPNQILISGWAFDEEKIAILLSQLENSPFFKDTQLLETERLSSREVWERSKLRKVSLIRFTIQLKLNNKKKGIHR